MATVRKVVKIGNSLGVSMTDLLAKIGAGLGDTLVLEVNEKNEIVIRKSNAVQLPEGVNPRLLEAIQHTIQKYDRTIKGLVDR